MYRHIDLLVNFHYRCVRTNKVPMCRINTAHSHTIRHHISSNSLFSRLGIEPLETYSHRRLLRWAGHISRMPPNRLPRMLLTGWVANPRPLGCPQVTWGRTLKKALRSKDRPTEFVEWCKIAANRDRWRLVCEGSSKQSTTSARNRKAIWTELRNGPTQTQ